MKMNLKSMEFKNLSVFADAVLFFLIKGILIENNFWNTPWQSTKQSLQWTIWRTQPLPSFPIPHLLLALLVVHPLSWLHKLGLLLRSLLRHRAISSPCLLLQAFPFRQCGSCLQRSLVHAFSSSVDAEVELLLSHNARDASPNRLMQSRTPFGGFSFTTFYKGIKWVKPQII